MLPNERKERPVCTGVFDYFPDALLEVAKVSKLGNDQHNPGQPLHWSKGKSTDHADCLLRHLLDRGTVDTDGGLHSAKVAWRALALLQTEIENNRDKASQDKGGTTTSGTQSESSSESFTVQPTFKHISPWDLEREIRKALAE